MRPDGRLLLTLLLGTVSAGAQSVSISNASHPYTPIEVGNMVTVSITGAAAKSAVTVNLDGAGQAFIGTTDESGNFSITVTEPSYYVGAHTEYWYVGGSLLTPVNPNSTYLPKAPTLPAFSIYANYTGSNCPGQSTNNMSCNGGTAQHWVYSPVYVTNHSSFVNSTDVSNAMSAWNNIQSKVTLSTSSAYTDMTVNDDDTIAPVIGMTTSEGGDCYLACFNTRVICNGTDGACLNGAAMYLAVIKLSPTTISTEAGYLGANSEAFAVATLVHELGHALRLGHATGTNYVCSEVQSIMFPSGSVLYGCGVSTANACDASGIDSVYPSAVPTCSETRLCGLTVCS